MAALGIEEEIRKGKSLCRFLPLILALCDVTLGSTGNKKGAAPSFAVSTVTEFSERANATSNSGYDAKIKCKPSKKQLRCIIYSGDFCTCAIYTANDERTTRKACFFCSPEHYHIFSRPSVGRSGRRSEKLPQGTTSHVIGGGLTSTNSPRDLSGSSGVHSKSNFPLRAPYILTKPFLLILRFQ